MTRLAKLLLILFLLPVCAFAATASASLSGKEAVEPGESLTLTFELSGSDIYGVSGTLSYNSNQLTCTDIKPIRGSGWKAESSGDHFLVYDSTMKNPVRGSSALFSVILRVSSELTPGTDIRVSCVDLVASDGVSDIALTAVSWSGTVPAEQEAPSTEATHAPASNEPTEPADVPVYIPEESLPVTVPTETAPESPQETHAATAPVAPVALEEPSGEPLWTYILFALACILVGIGAGILINQKYFKDT